jgi:3-oxoacyl-[acyl-carrier protein] reductase
MFLLKGYNALITGATGGIGQKIAHAFAKQGANLVISGTRESVLEELAINLKSTYGIQAWVKTCSLSNPQEVDQLFTSAEQLAGGTIHILVNNAGITRDNLAMRMKDDEWQSVIDVNLTSTFRLCRSAVKSMMRERYGRIINITSVVGVGGNPGQANYCASKAGMIGMSKSMAQEVATRGITINCVAPGFIESPMTHELPEKVKERILSSIPAGKMGEGNDIAASVAFLASNEAKYITGQTIHVNGGMLMI